MIKEKGMKTKILRRLDKFPRSKLEEVLRYIDKIENGESPKEKILSFAGTWTDIDKDLFDDLTENLIQRRRRTGQHDLDIYLQIP